MVASGQDGRQTARLLAFTIGCACATISGCSARLEADREPPAAVVSVVEARQITVPIMAEPIGTTTALQEVSIRARVRGYLKEMHFKEGADVKKEQLLFVIDEQPFKAQLAAAKAKLEQSEAALKKAQDSKAREVAAAQLTLSKSMLELAEVEERREQSLLSRKASSIEDVQRKQAIRKRDAAQVEADKASLDQAKADYDTALLAAQADVAEGEALVTEAEIELRPYLSRPAAR
jgi:multidrug efflux pump subunit AcrA (membrane-fusion protein)